VDVARCFRKPVDFDKRYSHHERALPGRV